MNKRVGYVIFRFVDIPYILSINDDSDARPLEIRPIQMTHIRLISSKNRLLLENHSLETR